MKTKIPFRRSVFAKVVGVFAVIIAILSALQMTAFMWSSGRLVSSSLRRADTQTEGYLRLIEDNLEHITMMMYDLYNDTDLERLVRLSPILSSYERAQCIGQVGNRLTNIKNSSELIRDVSVVIPDLQMVLHTGGHPDGNYSEPTEEMLAFLETLSNAESRRGMNYTAGEESIEMTLLAPMGEEMEFAIWVSLSPEALQRQYESVVTYSDEPYILRFPEEHILVDTTPEENPELIFQNEEKTLYNLDGEEYFTSSQNSSNGLIHVTQFLSKDALQEPLSPLYFMTGAFAVAVLLVLCIYAVFTYRAIQKPIQKLTEAFHKLENGDFSGKLSVEQNDDFAYLYLKYNDMLDRLQHLIYEVYDTKILLQKAELRQLQSQINPHFLYNSYFLLHRTIKEQDYDKAVRFSKEMGQYFQYITRNRADTVPLCQESRHAQIYADIQAMRFEERIEVRYGEFPQEWADVHVPRLIIQPLIENAFEHGLEALSENGILSVSFVSGKDTLEIRVEDNGVSLADEALEQMNRMLSHVDETAETTAVINIHQRIQGMFGKNSGLFFARSELGGLMSRIVIESPQGTKEDLKDD